MGEKHFLFKHLGYCTILSKKMNVKSATKEYKTLEETKDELRKFI